MKNQFIKLGLIIIIGLVSNATYSQSTSTSMTPAALLEAWEGMTNMVVGTAEAMPSEYYAFTPHTDLRDFAAQIGHTTGANYLFASMVAENFELMGSLGYIKVDDLKETTYNISARYHVSDRIALGAGYSHNDEMKTYNLSAALFF